MEECMRHLKPSRIKLGLLVAVMLSVAGCLSNNIKNIDLSAAGTYQLKLIDNSGTMPYTTGAGNQQVTLTAETMTLTEDTWSLVTIRELAKTGGTVTDTLTDGGTYTKNQDALTLHSTVTNSTAFTGTFATATLVLNGADGHTYIFGF
jgi:hypothetical protein